MSTLSVRLPSSLHRHLRELAQKEGVSTGYIPGFPGAHTQAETPDELNHNLREVISLLTEDGEPHLQAEFVGTQLVTVD